MNKKTARQRNRTQQRNKFLRTRLCSFMAQAKTEEEMDTVLKHYGSMWQGVFRNMIRYHYNELPVNVRAFIDKIRKESEDANQPTGEGLRSSEPEAGPSAA